MKSVPIVTIFFVLGMGWTCAAGGAVADECVCVGQNQDDLLKCALRRAGSFPDFYTGCEAYLYIAAEYARLGRRDKAHEVLGIALRRAIQIPEASSQSVLLFRIAGGYMRIHDLENALAVARMLPVSDVRCGALTHIAGELIRAGRFDDALRVSDEIRDPFSQALALYETLQESMAHQSRDAALKSWMRVRRAPRRMRKQFALITRYSLCDQTPSACLYDNSPDERYIRKVNALLREADLFIKSARYDEAVLNLKKAMAFLDRQSTSYFRRSDFMAAISDRYSSMRKYNEAVRVIILIPHAAARSWAWMKTAECYIADGDMEKALHIARGDIEVVYYRDAVYAGLIRRYFSADNPQAGCALAGGITSETSRSRLCAAVVESALRRRAYRYAGAAYAAIQDPLIRVHALALSLGALQTDGEGLKDFCAGMASDILCETNR